MNDKNLRKNLIELLRGGSAHVSYEKALEEAEKFNQRVKFK